MLNIFPNAFHLPHRRFAADTRKSHAETLLVQRGYQQAHRYVNSIIDFHEKKCVLHNIGIPYASPWSRFYRRCTYRIIPSTYKNYRISSDSSVGLLGNSTHGMYLRRSLVGNLPDLHLLPSLENTYLDSNRFTGVDAIYGQCWPSRRLGRVPLCLCKASQCPVILIHC